MKKATKKKAAKKFKLPNAMSGLIRVALADLIAVEKQRKRFEVDMSIWHRGAGQPFDSWNPENGVNKKCVVCFAGSVMAMSLGVADNETKDYEDFDQDTENKLAAIDALRSGNIQDAASILGIEPKGSSYEGPVQIEVTFGDVSVPEYKDNKPGFKKTMKNLADELEAAGY